MAAEGQKSSRMRLAFALACGLAICCSVMYITADGDEVVKADAEWAQDHMKSFAGKYSAILPKRIRSAMASTSELGSVKGLRSANIAVATATGKETKIESWDVKKADTILTDDTPDGRMTLLKYFNKVEKQIATEVAGRKADIAAIRVQMAKNMAYNAKARATMRKNLLHKMAINAKKAHDDLMAAMERTAKTFNKQEALNNARNTATIKRSKKTRDIMAKNKKEYQHNLHMAVLNQQRALAALNSATNKRISQTNKNIAANAAQIKINARKARKDLESAMGRFDKNMLAVTKEAAAGRSKLAATAKAMDRRFRAMVDNKIKGIVAWSSAQFAKVRSTMAKDRHHADMALKHAAQRMQAALNAHNALQDKRFKQTVANIKLAKAEAKARVDAATSEFKMNILHLQSTVKHQVFKLNSRVTALQGVITKNKLEQAKVNKNVQAEIKRMVKLGSEREVKLAKKNAALRRLMAKNKAATAKRMQQMAKNFMLQIGKIQAQMKKDRADQEHRLGKATSKLYATLAKNKAAQAAVNAQLTEATRRARLDMAEALRAAKHSFAGRLGSLNKVVVKNDKKANAMVEKLTGVEAAEALKSAKGRALLKMRSNSNKLELKTAIREAVRKGEQRAQSIEAMAKKMNAKTKAALNAQITTEISTVTKKIHSGIEDLQLATASARKQMKREILYAVRSAAALAKKQLKAVVTETNKNFVRINTKLSKSTKASASARAAIKAAAAHNQKQSRRAIMDAMANQARALLALKQETAKKIKKTNTNVAAYGDAVAKRAIAVNAQMAANSKALLGKINQAKVANAAHLKSVDAAAAKRHAKALALIAASVKAANKAVASKFGKAYKRMGGNRASADRKLGRATASLNAALAKRSALEDGRFAKTVKNIKGAKKAAWAAVTMARKRFTLGLASVTSAIKDQETRLVGDIAVVSGMIANDKAAQARINTRTQAEMARIVKLSDKNFSSSKRARGKLKALLDQNKVIAAQEVHRLKKTANQKIKNLRAFVAQLRREAATDLSKATQGIYEKLSAFQLKQTSANSKLKATLKIAAASANANIAKFKSKFAASMTTLVNTVTANDKKVEEGLQRITGVVHNWKAASAADRHLVKTEAKAMNQDLNKAIVKAIQLGEAKAKIVWERASSHVSAMQKAMQGEIAERVERMADNVFKTVQGNRATIANNYLAVKGFAGASKSSIFNYVARGKGRGLSSVGDFLSSVASISSVKTKASEGIGAGLKKVMPAFSGKLIPVVNDINKVNGLVNEYMSVFTQVRMRWRLGLGKYLLSKLSAAMQSKGILTVGKKSGAAGQWVYPTGSALGLSSKFSDFQKIACRITHYQNFLSKLTSKLPKVSIVKPIKVAPPEWQGN